MDEAMRVTEERCDLCRQKYAAAFEVVDDLKVALEAAELISRAAKHEYDEAWKAVRVLAGQQAWEQRLARTEAAAVCTTAASKVIVGIGWFANHIVRHRSWLVRKPTNRKGSAQLNTHEQHRCMCKHPASR
jgi:hypothetical protein